MKTCYIGKILIFVAKESIWDCGITFSFFEANSGILIFFTKKINLTVEYKYIKIRDDCPPQCLVFLLSYQDFG